MKKLAYLLVLFPSICLGAFTTNRLTVTSSATVTGTEDEKIALIRTSATGPNKRSRIGFYQDTGAGPALVNSFGWSNTDGASDLLGMAIYSGTGLPQWGMFHNGFTEVMTMRIYNEDSDNYVSFASSNSLSGDLDFMLPLSVGSAGQVLGTDGSGILSFVANTGYEVEPATVTFQLDKGVTASTGTFTDTVRIENGKELRLLDTGNVEYVGFKAPDAVTTSTDYFLPAEDGGNGDVLTTDGFSGLTWTPIPATPPDGYNPVYPATATVIFPFSMRTAGATFYTLAPGVMHVVAGSSNVVTSLVSLSTEVTGHHDFSVLFDARTADLPGANSPFISKSTSEARGAIYFDDTSTQTVTWSGFLRPYNGDVITAFINFKSSTSKPGTVNWGVYLECKTPKVDTIDDDTDSFGVVNSTAVTLGNTSGMPFQASLPLSNGDSCADGDWLRVKLERRAGEDDTALGWAKATSLYLEESAAD